MTQFFRNAHSMDKPPKVPKPVYPKFEVVQRGNGQTMVVDSAWARKQRGRSKGGQVSQQNGNGHRFTTETGRKAALKTWKRRRKQSHRGGRITIGTPARRRPAVNHAALRAFYSEHPTKGITWHPIYDWTITRGGDTYPLTERTALRHLGHLPKAGGFVPGQNIATPG